MTEFYVTRCEGCNTPLDEESGDPYLSVQYCYDCIDQLND